MAGTTAEDQGGQVAVLVTRQSAAGDLEVLATGGGSEPAVLPQAALRAGEHPAEGAWRATTEALGAGEFFAFRRLRGSPEGWYVFQTAPEGELPERASGARPEFSWRLLSSVVASAPAAPWQAAAEALASSAASPPGQ
jgi:hypothetical protein